MGCSDADRHFHHCELCVCSNESFDDYKFLFQSIVLAVNKNLPGKSIDPYILVCDAALFSQIRTKGIDDSPPPLAFMARLKVIIWYCIIVPFPDYN